MRNRYGVFAVFGFSAVLAGGCKSGTERPTPVATTVQVSADNITLTSIGETRSLTAVVLDQSGNTMSGQVVTWGSTNGAVATVNSGGVVTAVANGTAAITATSGSVTANTGVTVQQTAANLLKSSGDNQSGTVNTQMGAPIQVRVADAQLNFIPGVSVTFAVATGGGSLSATSVTSNSLGFAAVNWTLGQGSGAQTVTATVSGVGPVTFNATAIAGAPASMIIIAGDGQTATVNTDVTVDPQVRVRDSFNNPKSGASVTFAVTGGGGSITPVSGVVTTDAGGNAALTGWTVGGSAGANSLSATVTGTAISQTFNATAQLAGAPANIAVFVGNNQTGAVGVATNIRPAARVTDNSNAPVSGVTVNFAVGTGGGSINGSSSVVTNNNGVAQLPGGWVLGAGAGSNTITATAVPGGIANNPVTFTATGIVPSFSITLRFLTTVTAPQQAAFNSAAARWAQVVIADLPDIAINRAAGPCFTNANLPAVNETVDDVLIFVIVEPIDGPSQILGQAAPCNPGFGPPIRFPVGAMRFDDADLNNLELDGRLNAVILHEMAHVLGIGTLWPPQLWNVVVPTSSNPDAHYTGVAGRAAFDSIGGLSYTGLNDPSGCPMPCLKVPVENNTGLSGTDNGHWREFTFDEELMTGFIEQAGPGFSAPLSLLTIASLSDIGYTVSFAAADAYTQPFSVRAAFRPPAPQPATPWEEVPIPDRWIILDPRTQQVVRVIVNR